MADNRDLDLDDQSATDANLSPRWQTLYSLEYRVYNWHGHNLLWNHNL